MEDYMDVGVFQYNIDRDLFENKLMKAIWNSEDYRLRVEPSTETDPERKRIEAFIHQALSS